MEYTSIPHYPVPNNPNHDQSNEWIDLGAFPSPDNRRSRPSLAHARNESDISSLSGITYFDQPTLHFDNPPTEGKGDASRLLSHGRSTNPVSSTRVVPRKRYWLKDWWFWEIGGCLFSILCMAMTVFFIYKFHDKPNSDWKFFVSPNTFISTLITFTKTAILLPVMECISQLKWRYFWTGRRPLVELEAFDAASRGPWGAFVFAWKTRFKSWITLLGAFIVVGTLAMEPLAQQIVSFETRWHSRRAGELPELSDSKIYVTQAYNPEMEVNPRIGAFATPSDIQVAFFNGAYNSPYPISVSCVNGNCTWHNFLTLGVCRTCENITSESSYICLDSTNDTCVRRKYVFPYTWATQDYVITADNETGNHLVKSMAWTPGPVQDITDWNSNGLLTRFILGRFRDYWGKSNGDDVWHSDTPELTKCDLFWCAKLYENFKYQNSTESNKGNLAYNYTLSEIPLKRQPSPNSGVSIFSIDKESLGPHNETYLNNVYDATFNISNNEQRIFEVNSTVYNITSLFLTSMLNMRLTDTPISTDPLFEENDKYNQLLGRALLYYASIQDTIGNITGSISSMIQPYDDMQEQDGAPNRFVEAYTGVSETYVIMRKRWFAFTGSMVLLSLVFLVITIFLNRKANTPPWKSGSLPFLFHGLEGWNEYNDEEMKKMDARAEGMRAKLEKNAEGNIKFLKC